MSPTATSTWFLNSSTDCDYTTAPGSLCQYMTNLSVKKFSNILPKPPLV